MQNPSSASTLRHRRRLIWGPAVAALAAVVSAGACQSEDSNPSATVAPFSGNGLTTSGGTSGLMQGTAANNPASLVGAGGAGTVESGPSSDINLAANANNNSAGAPASAGGTSGAGNVSMAPKPCVDTEPPPDPDWPDANCERWATETTE
jgi:hypothetical protein